MKIFNETKTQKLNAEELDFEKGHLIKDKLFVAHHDATPFVKGRSAEKIADELQAKGAPVIELKGIPYFVNKVYKDGNKVEITPDLDLTDPAYGKSVTEIKAEPDTLAQEAWDEYEDIQVFVPYTADELAERKKSALRARRSVLLSAFDKWEKAVLRGRESDDVAVMEWYQRLLDLDELAFESIPNRVQYFIG